MAAAGTWSCSCRSDTFPHACSKGVLYQDQKQLAAKSGGWVQLLADRGYRAASRQPHSPASKADGVTGLETAVAVAGIDSSSCGDKTPQQDPVQQGSGPAGTDPHTPQQITAVDLLTRAQPATGVSVPKPVGEDEQLLAVVCEGHNQQHQQQQAAQDSADLSS